MTDEELEKVAREAKPEHDEDWEDRVMLSSFESQHQFFIAAFNPATALALLERVRGAESALATSVQAAKEWCDRAVKAEAKATDLQKEHDEDQGVIAVWRGRTERAEARVRELEGQIEDDAYRSMEQD
jgi:hypothetical protein